jgi:hypothetical protein
MTKREFMRIEKSLLAELPGFAISGAVMLIPPADRLLRGVGFEGSGLDKASFYADHLYFNFGKRSRHGGIERWNKASPDILPELSAAIKSQAIPFLYSANSLLDFAEMARQFNEKNPHTLRAIAYSLARVGEIRRAIDILDRLIVLCDLAIPWQGELAQEAQSLRSKLFENPEEAQRQLKTWESKTINNLGLAEERRTSTV